MKTLATLLAAAALSVAAAPPAPARACGDTHETETHRVIDRATATVEASFAAIAANDTKAFKKLWSKDAHVTSKNASGKGSPVVVSVRKVMKKWMKRRAGMSWTIDSVEPTLDGAEVHATVTWNGTTFDDVLVLKGDSERMVIVDKTTIARVPEKAFSGYGG